MAVNSFSFLFLCLLLVFMDCFFARNDEKKEPSLREPKVRGNLVYSGPVIARTEGSWQSQYSITTSNPLSSLREFVELVAISG